MPALHATPNSLKIYCFTAATSSGTAGLYLPKISPILSICLYYTYNRGMPELPEVETVRIGLQELLPGRCIVGVSSDWPKGFPNAPADVAAFVNGARVTQVRRRAKVLIIDLDTNYSLVIHLKM